MLMFVGIGFVWMLMVYNFIALPFTFQLRYFKPYRTAFMDRYQADDPIQYKWVDLKKISPNLRNAVVFSEDGNFFEHNGFDTEAIKNAIKENWKRKRFAFGGSTISQQLAKNLYLSASKNPLRKIREFFIALKLERELSKDRILELYLNVVEWGKGIYGAEAASRHYFGEPAAYLNKEQAAFLAAILPKPRFYDKHRNGTYLGNRVDSIGSKL